MTDKDCVTLMEWWCFNQARFEGFDANGEPWHSKYWKEGESESESEISDDDVIFLTHSYFLRD